MEVLIGCFADLFDGGTAEDLEGGTAWHVTEASLVLCIGLHARDLNVLHALDFGCFLFRRTPHTSPISLTFSELKLGC